MTRKKKYCNQLTVYDMPGEIEKICPSFTETPASEQKKGLMRDKKRITPNKGPSLTLRNRPTFKINI